MSVHERDLAEAFDKQAERFERAPVQSDPAALARLVRFADLPADCLLLDAGCGPGLVSAVFLEAGHRVVGVDLSSEMIARAHRRCIGFGERARFEQQSLFDASLAGPFDAAVSRFVLHHTPDPSAFVRRQAELLRPGGVLVLCDHTTDTDPAVARHHNELECARDRTHVRNLTTGQLADLFAATGLDGVRVVEEPFVLDFDEWFDRGTSTADRESVRRKLLAGPPVRGFRFERLADGPVRIHGWRVARAAGRSRRAGGRTQRGLARRPSRRFRFSSSLCRSRAIFNQTIPNRAAEPPSTAAQVRATGSPAMRSAMNRLNTCPTCVSAQSSASASFVDVNISNA